MFRLHYIPLSSGYSEIYNIYAYFSGSTPAMVNALEKANNQSFTPDVKIVGNEFRDGDAQLRKIARAGRKWKMTIGRKVDMEIYVYRLCLEYARLWADDRDAWTYKG
ncbi:capsule-associated protein CAP1 [Tulasnella sp. 403]|nr:capsule-associated protein CAP1 [Tulasnella sp. 403]